MLQWRKAGGKTWKHVLIHASYFTESRCSVSRLGQCLWVQYRVLWNQPTIHVPNTWPSVALMQEHTNFVMLGNSLYGCAVTLRLNCTENAYPNITTFIQSFIAKHSLWWQQQHEPYRSCLNWSYVWQIYIKPHPCLNNFPHQCLSSNNIQHPWNNLTASYPWQLPSQS